MASYCAKILRPLKTSLQKKKKKKKDANAVLVEFPLLIPVIGPHPSVDSCNSTLLWSLSSLAAGGGVWVPGADGELAGPAHPGTGAYKGARGWYNSPETGQSNLGRIPTG